MRRIVEKTCLKWTIEMHQSKIFMMKKHAYLVSILLFSMAFFTQAKELGVENAQQLQQSVDQFVASGANPFVYMRIEDREGKVVFEHSSVNQTLLPNTNINGNTISTVMDLVENNVIKLHDPVAKYIPEFKQLKVAVGPDDQDLSTINAFDKKQKANAERITCPLKTVPVEKEMTVLDLITHKAGFYYQTRISCLDEQLGNANLVGSKNSQTLIDKLADLPLVMQPGARYYYGTNTTVLGLVAERATGKSLMQLVDERVLKPLNIDKLDYLLPEGETLLPKFSGADGELRILKPGEQDIFQADVPDYSPDNKLYLGGEGMIGTTAGYADFLQIILNMGKVNGYRLLDLRTIDLMTSPQSQESEWGHDGFNIWVNSGKLSNGEQGRGGLWIGGGYEGTHYWIDQELGLVGLIMTQIYAAPPEAHNRDETLREAFYDQLMIDNKPFRE
jgi:CubicO group peptidase (beta-lactamase class C family)